MTKSFKILTDGCLGNLLSKDLYKEPFLSIDTLNKSFSFISNIGDFKASAKLKKEINQKKTEGSSTPKTGKKMSAIEKRNRERFGDAHVDKLKARHKAFKAARKKKK